MGGRERVDGQPIAEKRPVTLGKVMEAALILALGLPLASALARLMSRVLSRLSGVRWPWRLPRRPEDRGDSAALALPRCHTRAAGQAIRTRISTGSFHAVC